MPFDFASILGLFTNKLTRKFAWGILLTVVIGGFTIWSVMTIRHLQKENATIVLRMENAQQKKLIEVMEKDRIAFEEKTQAISESISALNSKMAANALDKKKTTQSMIGEVIRKPSGGIDTQPLEDKANIGMNKVFDDLEAISRDNAK